MTVESHAAPKWSIFHFVIRFEVGSYTITDAELMQIAENYDFWEKLSQIEEYKSGIDEEIVEIKKTISG